METKMKFKKPSVTADIIAIKKDRIILVKRNHDPFKGYWALPGGFLEVDKECIKETAKRELQEETGLNVKLDDLILLGESSNPKRDPRGHIVSIHYVAKKYTGKLKAGDDAKEVRYFPLYMLPKLAFDHETIIKNYTIWFGKNWWEVFGR
jgi:8-oxo-dGTP diphosphatase